MVVRVVSIRRVDQSPTHQVVHVDGFEANIYIARSLLNKLNDRNDEVRNKARASVCIRFRKALSAKYPHWNWNRRVDWHEIDITPISEVKRRAEQPSPAKSTDDRQCDDCYMCDQMTDHNKCNQPGGCPLAVPWPKRRSYR